MPIPPFKVRKLDGEQLVERPTLAQARKYVSIALPSLRTDLEILDGTGSVLSRFTLQPPDQR